MFTLPSGVVVRPLATGWVVEYDEPITLAPHQGQRLKALFGGVQ